MAMKRFSIFVAVALASNPAHALDLKKELERLRGGADAKETQTHATPAAAVGRTAPVAAASLRGRAAPADASRLAPQASRLGAIVKPTDPDAFECNPYKYKHKKTCFEGQRQCRAGKTHCIEGEGCYKCRDGEFLSNPPGVKLGNGGYTDGCMSCPWGDDPRICFNIAADFESAFDCMGCCFPDAFGTKKGLLIGACTSCGLKDNPDEVHYIDDCLTCEEGFEIIPMYSDCTGICVKSGRSVRSFKGMGFADLATSACTAYLDCYGGDDRKAIKVLPTDGTNSFPWDVSYSYLYWSFSYDFESYSYRDDDEYSNIVCDGQTPDNYCDCGSGPLGDCEANPSFCACEEAQGPDCCDGSAYSFSYGDVCVDGIIEVISGDHDGEGERCVQCDGQAPGDYCDCLADCEESDNCDCAEAKGPTCCGEGGRD